jgi:transcriptional regulator with XRE-family HTH domain
MTRGIGQLLRQQRKARSLTLEQAAQAAGIARVTLNRWETGVNQPRLSELDALLSALGASARQKQEALTLVDAPRAQAQIRETIASIAERAGIGPKPNGGDLLRALRIRSGLSLEAVAERLGVTTRTLRRWEKAEVWPSVEQLQTLCYVLQAREEEMIVLTCGHFSPIPRQVESPYALETLEAELKELDRGLCAGEHALLELPYLNLETQVWSLALRGETGKRLLALAYTLHAKYLDFRGYGQESAQVAERALELLPEKSPPEPFWVHAAIFATLGSVNESRPKWALARLRPWLPTAQRLGLQSWLLATMAFHMASDNRMEEALALNAEACREAQRSDHPGELERRKYFQAEFLYKAGRPEMALAEMPKVTADTPYFLTPLTLLRSELHLAVGETSEAQACLQRAMSTIEHYDLSYLRDRAETMTAQF